jgi:hypothetical protein
LALRRHPPSAEPPPPVAAAPDVDPQFEPFPVCPEPFSCDGRPGWFGNGFFGPPPELVGGSWNQRPLTAGLFAGALFADSLIDGQIEQDGDFAGGFRVGWDFAERWGTEMRFAFAAVDLQDAATSATFGDDDIFLWDVNLLYYPWGDTRWRPYLSCGVGMAHFDFVDAAGQAFQQGLFDIPLGGGIKYRARPWCVWRLDVHDNISFAGGALDTMHNVTLTFGVDYRFGGNRLDYWPWEPSTIGW